MKKILGLTIAALLVMALVGGGTWAYFSDVETTSDSTLTAGIMDLGTITGQNDTGTVDLFTEGAMAPGTPYTKIVDIDMESGNTLTPARFELDIDVGTYTNYASGEWASDTSVDETAEYEALVLVTSYIYEGQELLGTTADALGTYDVPITAAAANIQMDKDWATGGGGTDAISLADLKTKILFLTTSPGTEDVAGQDVDSSLTFGLSPGLTDNAAQGDAIIITWSVAAIQDLSADAVLTDP